VNRPPHQRAYVGYNFVGNAGDINSTPAAQRQVDPGPDQGSVTIPDGYQADKATLRLILAFWDNADSFRVIFVNVGGHSVNLWQTNAQTLTMSGRDRAVAARDDHLVGHLRLPATIEISCKVTDTAMQRGGSWRRTPRSRRRPGNASPSTGTGLATFQAQQKLQSIALSTDRKRGRSARSCSVSALAVLTNQQFDSHRRDRAQPAGLPAA